MSLNEKILSLRENNKLELQNGDTGYASAPSNIALLKYWGKKKNLIQIPENSSLSFTLSGFRSETKVTVLGRFFPKNEAHSHPKIPHEFILKNEKGDIISQECSSKWNNFLNLILSPYAPEIGLRIESQNNFPTACGIASSASGYAACVGAIANLLQLDKHFTEEELQSWISEWSRLGSGSATRSSLLKKPLEQSPAFVGWTFKEMDFRLRGNEEFRGNENTSNQTKTEKINSHKKWEKLKHAVLVLDGSEKLISSSEGHHFAKTSPLFSIRVSGMELKYKQLKKAIENFNFDIVKNISEEDAFSMHAVMQTATPPACYLTLTTSQVISHFVTYRNSLNMNAFWTLDAGPNIHFIYMEEQEHLMENFFNVELRKLNFAEKTKINIYRNKSGEEFLILGKDKSCNLI